MGIIQNTGQLPRLANLANYDVKNDQLHGRNFLQNIYRKIVDTIRCISSPAARVEIAARNSQVCMKIDAMQREEINRSANFYGTNHRSVSTYSVIYG